MAGPAVAALRSFTDAAAAGPATSTTPGHHSPNGSTGTAVSAQPATFRTLLVDRDNTGAEVPTDEATEVGATIGER